MDVSQVADAWRRVRAQLDGVVLGQGRVKDQLSVCFLAGGHALLEGVPGTAKTLLGLAFSRLLGCRFRRIQFTPDLMPVDLLGTNVLDPRAQAFEFHPGPIFTDLLLADEINRTPPRTQSALLEAMQEKAVTVDGVRRVVSPGFTVLATQNPVEFEGTYPLPEAQRDRFLLRVSVDYPEPEDEAAMLEAYAEGRRLHEDVAALEPVLDLDELVAMRRAVARELSLSKDVVRYLREVVTATRSHEAVFLGGGPRASLALLEASRALAVLRGREFVTPDDVKEMAGPALVHRVILTPEAEMEGTTLDDVLEQIFGRVEVPR